MDRRASRCALGMIAALQAFDFGRGEVSDDSVKESQESMSKKITTASFDVNTLFESMLSAKIMTN